MMTASAAAMAAAEESPPAPEAGPAVLPRDLVVLIDTSGSMSGKPLDQARRIVAALVDTLGEEDRLEMIAFSMVPRRWRSGPVPATEAVRRSAHEWLRKLQASGGTEMRRAVVEALRPLRGDAQRQVVLVTDGEIGFETEVVGEVLLAPGLARPRRGRAPRGVPGRWVSRQLEAAHDPEGLSSTARAVLGRITGEGRAMWGDRGQVELLPGPVRTLARPSSDAMMASMQRAEALRIIAQHEEELRQMGVRSLSLFGSVARDQAAPGSDVDLLVEFDRPVGYFHLFEVQDRLEALLGCKVDLITAGGLRPELRQEILAEAVRAA